MNILDKSQNHQISKDLQSILCKNMGVRSISKLKIIPYNILPAKNDFILYKKTYPEKNLCTNLTERVEIVKRTYNNMQYLNVTIYPYTKLGWEPKGITFTVTKIDTLWRILVANRRSNLPKIDIILPEKIKTTISNRIIKYHKLLRRNSNIMNSGIILHGPPGNGKTSILKYIEKKCKMIVKVTTNDINSERISENKTPYIYILDDVSLNLFDEKHSAKTASFLRNVMDGDRRAVGVWVLSTNEDIKIMHEAFLRPGRFDTILEFPRPTDDLRRKLIETWKMEEIDTEDLVAKSDGWSFAELSYIKNYMITQKLMGEPCTIDDAIASREFSPSPDKNTGKIGFGV